MRLERRLNSRSVDRRWCDRGEGFGCVTSASAAAPWCAGGPFCRDFALASFFGWPAGDGAGEGILRTTESWSSTKDSLGSAGVRGCACGCEGLRGECGEGLFCAALCHAVFTDVGEGSCASFSAREIDRDVGEGAGGRDAAIISYADGDRSTKEASN